MSSDYTIMPDEHVSALHSWLSIPQTSASAAEFDPKLFLKENFYLLPPHLIAFFSPVVSPRDRALLVPSIRKRRLKFADSAEGQRYLSWQEARSRNPELFARAVPISIARNSHNSSVRNVPTFSEEQDYFDGPESFLARSLPKSTAPSKHTSLMKGRATVGMIGKLGRLLADEEDSRIRAEERSIASRVRREQDRIEEVESASDSDDDEDTKQGNDPIILSLQEQTSIYFKEFELLVRERWVDGRSEDCKEMFDSIDWDEKWDQSSQDDSQHDWFDNEE